MKSPKRIITALLLVACILSGIIYAYTPKYIPNNVTTEAQLDSLIRLTLEDANILPAQIRTFNVEIDTSFTRKVYRVRVPSSFSKTSYHLELHKEFYPLGLSTPTRVVFPEQDMNIYIVNDDTIFRTIRLITDSELSKSIAE